jgi:hypothetical protein
LIITQLDIGVRKTPDTAKYPYNITVIG